jgi:hypothetical protein
MSGALRLPQGLQLARATVARRAHTVFAARRTCLGDTPFELGEADGERRIEMPNREWKTQRAMGAKSLTGMGLLAVSAWAGGPVGGLVGLFSAVVLLMVFESVRKAQDQVAALVKLKWHLLTVMAVWFGSGVGTRVISSSDWQKVGDWYLASLFLVVAVLVGPVALLYSFKLAMNTLRS